MGTDALERQAEQRLCHAIVDQLQHLGMEARPVELGGDLVRRVRREKPDFVVPALLGEEAEDGTLQRMLEGLDVECAGAPLDTCSLCWDKQSCKQRLQARGVSTPPWRPLDRTVSATVVSEFADEVGFPLVVKPARGAGARGVTILRRREEVGQAVAWAFEHDDAAIVERFVVGPEFAVTLLGAADDPRILPIVEVVRDEPRPPDRQEVATTLAIADLGADDRRRLRAAAGRAYEAVEGRDLAQVKIVLDASSVPQVLAVGSSPSLAARSPALLSVAAAGMTLGDLVRTLISRVQEPSEA